MPTIQRRGVPPLGARAADRRELAPDTELLGLWARFLELMTVGRDLHDKAFDRVGDEMAVIERQLGTMTAATPEGVAVLLRVGFLRSSYGDELQDRYLGDGVGDDPPPNLDPLLWQALVSIERQTRMPIGHHETAGSREAAPAKSGTAVATGARR